MSVPDGVWHWWIAFLFPMVVYCHIMYHLGIQFRRPNTVNCCVLINPHEILMASAVGHGPHDRRAGPGLAWLSAGLVPEWVALAAKAGRRFQKPPKAPRSATPAMPYRPLPISARCGSPSLYWPGPGVQHGPYMQHDRRNGPQPAPGWHRLLM